MNEGTVLRDGGWLREPCLDQVVEASIERGWLRPFGRGQWVYSGLWAELFRGLQGTYLDRIRRLGFAECAFPRLLPIELADQLGLRNPLGLTTFRPGLLFEVRAHGESGPPTGFLDPLQNITMYQLFRGTTLQTAELPVRMVEALGGWTWRNEDPMELDGTIRALEFLRVEAVFIGIERVARDLRRAVEDAMVTLLEDLRLPWRVAVGVGCMESAEMAALRSSASDEREIPVHDVEVYLGPGRWLEVGGCSVESRHLLTEFGISAADGSLLDSGCCGLGFNRLVNCLLAHHGLDVQSWPGEVRDLCRLD